MKKSLILAPVVIPLGYAVALITLPESYSSINMLSVPAVLGGVFACGLLLFAFSDYLHKPRFRVRNSIVPAATHTSPEVDAASAWTYATLSA